MSNSNPDSLHEAVHQALVAGEFETARQLSRALGQAITAELAAAGPAKRAALLERRLSRFQEHLSLACVLRAHLASQLRANTAVCLYQPVSGRNPSWRFDA